MQYFGQLFLENKFYFNIFALNGKLRSLLSSYFPNENSQSIWPDTTTIQTLMANA